MLEAHARDAWNHTAHLVWIVAEVNRDRAKQPRPFQPRDFHPLLRETREAEEPAARVGVEFLAKLFID